MYFCLLFCQIIYLFSMRFHMILYSSYLLRIVVNSISVHEDERIMLNRNMFCCFRSALFHRQLLIHTCRHHHSCISVKQALETVPSGSIPVVIKV